MRVEQFLSGSAQRYPDKTALVDGSRRLSYRELDEQVSRFAQVLRARGLQRGDRVVIYAENCAEAVVAIFGTLRAGGVFSPVNPTTKADKLAFILGNCRAEVLVTQVRLLEEASEAIARSP